MACPPEDTSARLLAAWMSPAACLPDTTAARHRRSGPRPGLSFLAVFWQVSCHVPIAGDSARTPQMGCIQASWRQAVTWLTRPGRPVLPARGAGW